MATAPEAKPVLLFNHSNKDRDCDTPARFQEFIAKTIFTRDGGRYRHRQVKRHVGRVVLALDNVAYGHFNIVGNPEKPTKEDIDAFPDVGRVYLVQSAELYATPVPLTRDEVSKLHIGQEILPTRFAEILRLAEGTRTIDAVASDANVLAIPMIFFRVGWMRYYAGQNLGDQIKGGGQFVEDHGYGHEMFNFLPYDGRNYGYVRPPAGRKGDPFVDGAGIKLDRISANCRGPSLDGVLVVWVATAPNPDSGTYIVGWYRNATVYRKHQLSPPASGRNFKEKNVGYYATAISPDAVLLDLPERTFRLPPLKEGGMGQSNTWYADGAKHVGLRRKVLQYIETRSALRKRGGRPKQCDPLLRTRVEQAAVNVVTAHFRGLGYDVISCEQENLGWDLEATCGSRKLLLEVKGLSGTSLCVELTPNEFAKMDSHKHSYCLCIVTRALSSPELAVFSYSVEGDRWQDERRRTLLVECRTGARCSLE